MEIKFLKNDKNWMLCDCTELIVVRSLPSCSLARSDGGPCCLMRLVLPFRVADFWSAAIQLNILDLKITLNMMGSLIHRPLLVLTGPRFDRYEEESSLCLWKRTVSVV